MPVLRTIHVLAYHGTSEESAQKILNAGKDMPERFLISENDTDWLGDGVYFFQDAPYRAREWPAIRMPPPRRTMHPVVLCAELELTDCLDLIDIKAAENITRWYPDLKKEYRRTKRILPKNDRGKRFRDRILVNYTVEQVEAEGQRVNSVRAAFKEGNPIVSGSQLYSHAHVQIVVRPNRTDVIKDVWLHTFEGED